MRRLAIALLLAACSSTQPSRSTVPSSPAVVEGNRVPANSTVWVRLDEKISAHQNRVGDRFAAHLTTEVLSPTGEVMVPKGARVLGRITELQPAHGSRPATVRLQVESIEFEGYTQPLVGEIIRAEVAPWYATKQGKHVAVGGGGGALTGGMVGGAISLGTGDQIENALPKDTGLAIRIDRPVRSLAALRRSRFY